MKKMYFLTLSIIILITFFFVLFATDENIQNRRFLASYGIETLSEPVSYEETEIPYEFDNFYKEYNLLQIQSGLDLFPYRGRKAVRYTYRITNFPDNTDNEIFANIISVSKKPVAGDINCPSLSGFILPLSYMTDTIQ